MFFGISQVDMYIYIYILYNYVNMFGYLKIFLLIIMQYFGESNNYAIFWGI